YDLATRKQELEFNSKLERSAAPDRQDAVAQSSAQAATAIAAMENAETQATPARATSSAEYIASRIKQRRVVVAAGLAVLLLAAIGFGYWFYAHRGSNLAPIESIAVLPFVNASDNALVEHLS